ncbi:extracellular solute-binding protein [Mahella australiensis]|uniref:Extracellular solute-binding protein family 1 n=1 Tax=Mahella australiensis (strain DSM 15567 / CIP 107919 / 50-1 BON) TaxID=697281 RepID=F3ZWS7_MAHA5|nr:extracellular solute-binding protein [Mahella australiensis]AEE96520.1 extracellular solute-binding protein family 1 [Mahella australiensis 50-1 BON]
MVKKMRWLSAALVVLLLVSTLAACSGASDTEKAEEPNESSEATNNKTEGEREQQKTGPSWSWDTSPVTLDWYIDYDWAAYTWDAKNRMMNKLVTEKTGVTVNVITPAAGGSEKLNAMIAGGTLPDIVTLWWASPQFKLMVQGGLVYSINELSEKYAPELMTILPKSMIETHKFPDGNLYGIVSFFWAPEEMDPEKNYWETNAGILARQDIMDQLGITRNDFSTQEGAINALKKVKDSDIKYQGVKVEPMTFGAEGMDAVDLTLPAFFGVPMEDEQGNYIDQRLHPKYLEVVKFANRLYREGLVSKEVFTSQRQQIEEKIKSGSVFSFLGNVGDYQGPMYDLYKLDKKAKFVTVEPIRSNDGSDPVRIESGIGWNTTCVTKQSKHPDRAIRFLEFLYSEEGDLIQSYGIEGETYKVNADGTIELMPELLQLQLENPEEFDNKYGFGGFGWLVDYVRVQKRTKPVTETDKLKQDWYKDMSKIVYHTTLFEKLGPDPGTDASNKLTQIDEYWRKQVAQMMVAESEAECERIYNETIQQMNKMGMQDIIKIRNENFQKNKQAAGVKYAWPTYNE